MKKGSGERAKAASGIKRKGAEITAEMKRRLKLGPETQQDTVRDPETNKPESPDA